MAEVNVRQLQASIEEAVETFQDVFATSEGSPSLYEVNRLLTLFPKIAAQMILLRSQVKANQSRIDFDYDVLFATRYEAAKEALLEDRETKREPAQEAIRLKAMQMFSEELSEWQTKKESAASSVGMLDSYERYLRDCMMVCKTLSDNLRFMGIDAASEA